MRLSDMKENQEAIIKHISKNAKNKRRLYDLGFMPGQRVKCTNKAIFGSPIAYDIQGVKIALRRADAGEIGVSI